MRLERLTIENFKGIEYLQLSIAPQFNLLVGDNGTGKTTILDAASVALGSWCLGFRGVDSRHIRRDEIREVVYRHADADYFEKITPVVVEAAGKITLPDGNESPSILWNRTLESPKGRTTTSGASELKSLAEWFYRHAKSGEDILLPLISYYGSGRLWAEPKKMSGRKKPSRFDGYKFSHEPRVSAAQLCDWMRHQTYAQLQEGTSTGPLTAVREAIAACFDGEIEVCFNIRRERLELIDRDHATAFEL